MWLRRVFLRRGDEGELVSPGAAQVGGRSLVGCGLWAWPRRRPQSPGPFPGLVPAPAPGPGPGLSPRTEVLGYD